MPRCLGIEVSGRLVDQQQSWILDQRAGDADALSLPAGKFVRQFVDHIVEADAFRSASADLMASNAQLYLQHLSSDEIAELNNFYSTATGKKMLNVIPMLMQQSLYLGQE